MKEPVTPIVLDIPLVPPSPNKSKTMHWGAYKRLRKVWKDVLVIVAGRENRRTLERNAANHVIKGGKEIFLGNKLRISMKMYHGERKQNGGNLYDPDNLVGSVKIVLDAMRDAGFLKNDTGKYVEIGDITQERAKLKRTIITIEEAL